MGNAIKLQRILIAVDDSQYSEKAAAYGFELAGKLNAQVALLHVDEMPVVVPQGSDPLLYESTAMVPELISIQEENSKRLLKQFSESAGDLTVQTFQKSGNPREEILAVAEDWDADIIILGTHGRTGLDHFISGSVAEGVVRKAKCPVLIIPNK